MLLYYRKSATSCWAQLINERSARFLGFHHRARSTFPTVEREAGVAPRMVWLVALQPLAPSTDRPSNKRAVTDRYAACLCTCCVTGTNLVAAGLR